MENLYNHIHQNFERHADRTAFFIQEESFTYSQLKEKVDQVSGLLESLQLSPQEVVGVVTNDDLTTYASVVALWKNNLVYLPVHPKHPADRNNDIFEDSGTRVLLSSIKDVEGIPTGEFNFYPTEELKEGNVQPLENRIVSKAQNLAYILYTSGSTGKPKGVSISHENFVSFIDSMDALELNITEEDKCLQCFDITFDVGIQSFVLPLVKGASVYTVPHDVMKFSYVYELLEDHQLSIAVVAPSMIKLLRPYFDDIRLPDLRVCILTAEASKLDLIKEWKACIPQARIMNLYGPTECTVYCTGYEMTDIDKAKGNAGLAAIGQAFKHVECRIWDLKEGGFLATEDWGELCLAGGQLTSGYWNNEQLNSTRFFDMDGTRYYKTGDRCRWEDGVLIYGGRLDNQVKLQGFRVELGEVEHRIQRLTATEVVAVVYDEEINTRLALFCLDNGKSTEEIMDVCTKNLPGYMIPSRIELLTDFPLNVNQKVDRKALKKRLDK